MKIIHRCMFGIELDDGTELHLEFEPVEDSVKTQEIGDTLVVGYLSRDESGMSNPMEDLDGQGDIYLRPPLRARDATIWDDEGQLRSALHIDSSGTPDIDAVFVHNGEKVTLRSLARDSFPLDEPEDEDSIENWAYEIYRDHWRELAGPFVVPISYHRERGSTSIRVVGWDGDTDDLPEGVWVANSQAEENIRAMATDAPMGDRAAGYASSILSELSSWCDGNVYGVCIEVFHIVGPDSAGVVSYVRVSDDAVWGHIGDDWAKQALDEAFSEKVRSLP